MSDERYRVNSSQVRGEPRDYWIEERVGDEWRNILGTRTTSKNKAERVCQRLNEQAHTP